MKDGGGGDHLSVAVKGPSEGAPAIIPNRDLFIKPPGIKIWGVLGLPRAGSTVGIQGVCTQPSGV
jgi:hypothetical protein